MAWISHNGRKFTTADSFQRFMEGLRALQLYDDEAAKKTPDASILNDRINEAAGFFEGCVASYPKDILPRYYRAIVLSIQGQIEQALLLQTELKNDQAESQPKTNQPAATEAASGKAELIFQQAAAEFAETSSLAGRGELLLYAEYNQAQMLAKLNR